MADPDDRVDWHRVFDRGGAAGASGAQGKQEWVPFAARAQLDRAVPRLVGATSLALLLSLTAWAGPDTWVSRSPFLLAVECVVTFVLLLPGRLGGLSVWGLSGDRSLAYRAGGLLPAGEAGVCRSPVGMVFAALLCFFLLLRLTRNLSDWQTSAQAWRIVLWLATLLLALGAVVSVFVRPCN